jgi:hypothetical protein
MWWRRLVRRLRGDGSDASKRQDGVPGRQWWFRTIVSLGLLIWRTTLLVPEWLHEHWF